MTTLRSWRREGEESLTGGVPFRLSTVLTESTVDQFFDTSLDAMFVADRNGTLVAANPAAGRLFGYRFDDLAGRELATLFTVEENSHLVNETSPAAGLDGGPGLPSHLEVEGKKRGGRRFLICLTLTPLADSLGDYVLGVMRDSSFCTSVSSSVTSSTYRTAVQEMTAFQRQLLVEVSRGRGVVGIANALHQRIGREVLILDPSGRILACGGRVGMASTSHERLPSLPTGSLHAVCERTGDGWTADACPDQTLLGRITVSDPDNSLPEASLLALEQTTSILAAELLRMRGMADAEVGTLGEFAAELLDGCDADLIHAYAKSLGYDFDKTHRAIAIQTEETNKDRIQAVEQVAKKLGVRTPMITTRSNRTVLLIPDELDWELLASDSKTILGVDVRIGVGGRYPIEEARLSLAEAVFALELGTTVKCDQPVTTFGDLGVWRLLVDSGEPRKLREIVDEWIGVLIDHDKLHNSELVKTLTVYLKESCGMEAASAALFVHRNTLRYRLTKISQIIDRDPGDADQRFQLELACRAWVVLQALEAA